MDCTLVSSLILFSGITFGAFVGFVTESVLTARGYKPINYLAIWCARRQSWKATPVSQPA